MDSIPSMWRTELWQPLSVHFPIALLSLAAAVAIALPFFRKRKPFSSLRFTYSLLLWSGLLAFWIAFYTGQLAYDVEVRRLCDPGVLKKHLRWSYISGIFFSIAALCDPGQAVPRL
ncbi:hypothetical protein [Pelagicoccus sp. SDUM812002]|uniref:hypothetical protein n=1 Tax=Pelagicoccus sp. SDUM812002 TaxID=3041266 RepID=UPI00280E2FA0|nr:hypothetical protein [Pelagicoccus sp. SDUM812002]MDQ8184299.1 hypothetical protein [Pelagicoccus sp. SDUM812002]